MCTEITGEGIDLHRYCRIVIHYDLDFNPAKVEQRTGRCDRIDSKRQREDTSLLVGVPLLAGSYDERIYARLLQRDQTNEALLGGDLSASDPDADVVDHDTSQIPHNQLAGITREFSSGCAPSSMYGPPVSWITKGAHVARGLIPFGAT